jgi:replicative DNA helicase
VTDGSTTCRGRKADGLSDEFIEPPFLDAERSVLASMMLDEGAIGRAVELIDSPAFYRTSHAKLFDVLVGLCNARVPVDLITVAEELRQRGDLEAVGGPTFLAQIMEYATTAANLEAHCHIVRQAANRRRVNRFLLELQAQSDRGTDDADLSAGLRAAADELDGLGGRSRNRFAEASVNAVDLLTMEIPKPRSLLGDGVLTQGGFAILYGAPGLGKSWKALTLGRALARGEPWCGLSTLSGGVRVGILQLELGEHAIQARLRTLGVGGHERDSTLFVVSRPKLRGAVDFCQRAQLEELRAWILNQALDVVIVDAFARAHTASENKTEELGPVLAALDSLRHETGCAVVLVHHERKSPAGSGRDDDLDALRGHSRLQSDPTLLMRVRRTSGGLCCLVFVKVTEGATPAEVYFRIGESGVPEVVQSPESKAEENRTRVLQAVLRAGRPVTRADVESLTGLGRSATAGHLKALCGESHITASGSARDVSYSAPIVRPSEPSVEELVDEGSSIVRNGLGDSDVEQSTSGVIRPSERPHRPPLGGGTVDGRTSAPNGLLLDGDRP